MEWKNLSDKLKNFSEKSGEIVQVVKVKSKEYWDQASDFTLEKIRQSSMCVKTPEELATFLREPIGMLLCVDETESESQQLLLKAPILLAQHFKEPVTIRVAEKKLSEEILQVFEISHFPSIIIFEKGEKKDVLFENLSLGEITRHLSAIQS